MSSEKGLLQKESTCSPRVYSKRKALAPHGFTPEGKHLLPTGLRWLGDAKVSFILRHRGAQLILAYSWARPAILVAGKGRGGCFYFFCFFTFIPVPLSSLSLSFISSTISSIFFLPFSGRRHKMTHKG